MTCYEKDCHYVMTHDGDCFYEGLPMDKKESCPMYKAKTNADRIRAMTDEELAHLLHSAEEHLFIGNLWNYDKWTEWLKQESEGE